MLSARGPGTIRRCPIQRARWRLPQCSNRSRSPHGWEIRPVRAEPPLALSASRFPLPASRFPLDLVVGEHDVECTSPLVRPIDEKEPERVEFVCATDAEADVGPVHTERFVRFKNGRAIAVRTRSDVRPLVSTSAKNGAMIGVLAAMSPNGANVDSGPSTVTFPFLFPQQ